MGLETGVTYIEDLVATNPNETDNDTLDEADNHMRLIKTAVQGSFPSLGAAAVTKTAAQINDLTTLTGAETLTNKTLTSPTVNTPAITTPTINGEASYGLVVLDTPVSLITITATAASWQQLDMSVVYAAAATANATKAILRVRSVFTSASTDRLPIHIQKNGLGGAADGTNIVSETPGAGATLGFSVSEVTVNLDGNSDFEWQQPQTVIATYSVDIYIVGYYV